MSIRLASAHDPARTAVRQADCRGLVTRAWVLAANDNGCAAEPATGAFDPVLVKALRHFARYGLNSARVAQTEAERSAREGSRSGAKEWIEITDMFDRRLATVAQRELVQS